MECGTKYVYTVGNNFIYVCLCKRCYLHTDIIQEPDNTGILTNRCLQQSVTATQFHSDCKYVLPRDGILTDHTHNIWYLPTLCRANFYSLLLFPDLLTTGDSYVPY
ncbi:GMP synthase [glutamine-hydrolyzing] [Labeo rohita]|uniref:GMP synthase [glutamine-hydrolyzing] n=1 Tax=Labeo rohita TaxID=84645 RepID=A0ABQ8MI13_LABRO|nr:GMP synthase [glutamine-hydrolyzing] [Labeo rohita]